MPRKLFARGIFSFLSLEQIPTKQSLFCELITFINGLEEDFIRTTCSETALTEHEPTRQQPIRTFFLPNERLMRFTIIALTSLEFMRIKRREGKFYISVVSLLIQFYRNCFNVSKTYAWILALLSRINITKIKC